MSDDLLSLPPDAPPQLRRAAIFVSVGDFANADVYCEKVLDETPENAYAYLLKAMAKGNVQKAEQLVAVPDLPEQTDFKLARQFADAELAAKLDELKDRVEKLRTIREACVARQRTLQEFLKNQLSDNLAAEVRTRLEAEQALMTAPDPAKAEREAVASAAKLNELKNEIAQFVVELKRISEEEAKRQRSKAILDNAVRAVCAVRIRTLQKLLARDIPDDLAAEVRTRLDAEQALMRAPTPDAAEREADLTAALREKIAPYCRTQLAELLPQLEKLVPNQNLPKNDRKLAARRCNEIRALLADPGADLRTLCYESTHSQIELERLQAFLEDSSSRIVVLVLLLLVSWFFGWMIAISGTLIGIISLIISNIINLYSRDAE